MSKLSIINEALMKNPDISIFVEREEKSFGESMSGGLDHDAHHIRYVVAPKMGIYSVSKLNDWFKGLIPNYLSLKPEHYEKFWMHQDDKNKLELAHIRFDEEGIGYVETITTRVERIMDEDFLDGLKGFKHGLRVRKESSRVDLGRMISIFGCPDENSTKTFMENIPCMSVKLKKLYQ